LTLPKPPWVGRGRNVVGRLDAGVPGEDEGEHRKGGDQPVSQASAAVAGPGLGGGLAVEDVSVSFGGLRALDGVSITVDRGEVVGLIGPNGAGKTTLFNVVCGFVRPASGRLAFDGRLLERHQSHDLVKLGIARTLQGVGLWQGLSVAENVMAGAQPLLRAGLLSAFLGLWRSGREEARLRQRALELLERLGIEEWAGHLPDALPYAVRKQTALARALMARPSLLLLDEPAGGLSEPDLVDLGSLLREFRADMGVLLVEHHMDFVMSVCDRLVVLDFGRVISSGSPKEVQADPAVTTAYLGENVEAVGPRQMGTGPRLTGIGDPGSPVEEDRARG
jgi:branched-chain amino acid transport system ATP-binding protein